METNETRWKFSYLTPYITDITEPRWASLSHGILVGIKRVVQSKEQVWDNW